MKQYSLRRRLLLWISIPVLLASILSLLVGFLFSWHEIEEVYDAQMVHSAKLLLQIAKYEIIEQKNESINLGEESDVLKQEYENKTAFRIWHHNKIMARSWNTDSFSNIEASPGFSDINVGHKQWRFFVFIDEVQGIKIEIAQLYSIRYELIIQLMSSLIAPGVVFIPLIFLIVWIGVQKALKPVVKLSTDVDKRNSDDLSSIHSEILPQEVTPIIVALNRLFERIQESFKREREFTDHAAHELRTPLAAMKTQTQVLIKKAKDMPDCTEGLENLNATINRSTHMIEQLLSLARLQNEELPKVRMSLSNHTNYILNEMRPQALQKNITLEMNIANGVHIMAHADSIAILIRNLIDNAIKYTPQGGHIGIKLLDDGLLEIADTGPGLSDADKVRVFDRFIRVDKTGQSGSGLGLSIARWIAKAHEVDIALLDNKPNGLKASIKWKITP